MAGEGAGAFSFVGVVIVTEQEHEQLLYDIAVCEGENERESRILKFAREKLEEGQSSSEPDHKKPTTRRGLVVAQASECLRLWDNFPDFRRKLIQRWLDHAGWKGSFDEGKWKAGFCGAGASFCLSAGFINIGWDSVTEDGYVEKDERTATPSYMKKWFEEKNLLSQEIAEVQPGDLVFTSEGKTGHVAVVLASDDHNELVTVEFNYSGKVKQVGWSEARLKKITGFGLLDL